MPVLLRADRDGDRVRVVPAGRLELSHLVSLAQAVTRVEATLEGCRHVDVDLNAVERIDGSGAVVLAQFIDRFAAAGAVVRVASEQNQEAARLINLYRERRHDSRSDAAHASGRLARVGLFAARAPAAVRSGLDFTGRATVAGVQSTVGPRSVDWGSLPRLVQAVGASGLLVTAAANLLVGLIIGFLGVAQLARFGATRYVPELVVVAQFRELGPLVTAIVVAGRSGAGLASEIATMQVSEEIDALRSMGFDPLKWLVVPRCLALVISVPVLTWVGHLLALSGGLIATIVSTTMSTRTYITATADAITATSLVVGLLKTPFLALAIGLIACGQGLATRGGAAAVGTRTTSAVVLSLFGVISISALFTLLYAFVGV